MNINCHGQMIIDYVHDDLLPWHNDHGMMMNYHDMMTMKTRWSTTWQDDGDDKMIKTTVMGGIVMVSVIMTLIMMIRELVVKKMNAIFNLRQWIKKVVVMMTTQMKKLMARKKRSFQKSSTAKRLRALTEQWAPYWVEHQHLRRCSLIKVIFMWWL